MISRKTAQFQPCRTGRLKRRLDRCIKKEYLLVVYQIDSVDDIMDHTRRMCIMWRDVHVRVVWFLAQLEMMTFCLVGAPPE